MKKTMETKKDVKSMWNLKKRLGLDRFTMESKEEWLHQAGKGILLFVYAFLLSAAKGLFDTYPFALSLLAALPNRLGYAFAGAALGTLLWGKFSLWMLLGYGALFLWRRSIAHFFENQTQSGQIEEPLLMRCVASAAIGVAVVGLPMIGNFTFFGLFGLIFMLFACPSLTLVFSGAFLRGRTSVLVVESGWCLLRFCLVLACRYFSLFGFVPALAVAAWLSVLTFTESGPIASCFSGFFTGLALGLEEAVLFAAMSLVGGVTAMFRRKLSVGAGLLAGMAYGYAVLGTGALFSVFPDLVCGGLLALPVMRLRTEQHPMHLAESPSAAMQFLDNADKELRTRQEECTRQSMQKLSSMFAALSMDRLPNNEECHKICEDRLRLRCGVCKGNVYCRAENETVRRDAFFSAAKSLKEGGRVDKDFLLEIGCMYSAEISEELALDYANLYRNKCRPMTTDAYAASFEVMSDLLLEQQQLRRLARRAQPEKAAEITAKARRLGLIFSSVGVYGSCPKSVFFCECKGPDCRGGAMGLQALCQEVLGEKVSFPQTISTAKGSLLVLKTLPSFEIQHAETKKAKGNRGICGDLVHSFVNDKGNPCLLLCDGMGSGNHAAVAAGIGCSLSECLSRAGASPKLITKLLNTALRHRAEEDSCSFDLFCFDRYTGRGTFIKNGAAPTLVFRGGSAYKLSEGSLPLGIVAEVESEQICMQLQAGDIVVLVSDGIAADFEDAAALAGMVAGHEERTAKELADRIIAQATDRIFEEGNEKKSDDMSVCVVKIEAVIFEQS